VTAETFKSLTGAPFNIIPYRQFAQLTADLMAGRIHALFNTSPGLVSLVKEGKLKALAYPGVALSPALPQVPTAIEIGFPQLGLNPSVAGDRCARRDAARSNQDAQHCDQ
jgi:tripartite-type tricarboxylate transporter receptor subunit TctC